MKKIVTLNFQYDIIVSVILYCTKEEDGYVLENAEKRP